MIYSMILIDRIPKDEQSRSLWLDFGLREYNIKSIGVNNNSRVCSSHFTTDCFNIYNRSVNLKPNSIPTLIVERVKHVSK